MLEIDEQTIDYYLADFDGFKYDLKRWVYLHCKAFGLYPDIDDKKLRISFDSWLAEIEVWESCLISNGTERLSHIKIFAIMAWALSRMDWVRCFNPFDMSSERLEYCYAGSPDTFDEVRADIVNGKEQYLAFEFAHAVICSYEQHRLDRVAPFVSRLTDDLRHDIIVYLKSDAVQSVAFYLIMKALFARDAC
jgi:hypothetical protein